MYELKNAINSKENNFAIYILYRKVDRQTTFIAEYVKAKTFTNAMKMT